MTILPNRLTNEQARAIIMAIIEAEAARIVAGAMARKGGA